MDNFNKSDKRGRPTLQLLTSYSSTYFQEAKKKLSSGLFLTLGKTNKTVLESGLPTRNSVFQLHIARRLRPVKRMTHFVLTKINHCTQKFHQTKGNENIKSLIECYVSLSRFQEILQLYFVYKHRRVQNSNITEHLM